MTVKGRHGDDGLTIGRKTMQPIYDFIEAEKDKPFFVWYAPMLPHQPHDPPERLLAKYAQPDRDPAIAKYCAMCEWFDETCGELLDWLDAKKLSDNTLVVFVVDNGWIQARSGDKAVRTGSNAPKSKLSPYDGGVRTPDACSAGRATRRPAATTTWSRRSICCRRSSRPAARSCPTDRPGLSLLDVAAGHGKLKRNAVFGEIHSHTAVDIEKPDTSVDASLGPRGRMEADRCRRQASPARAVPPHRRPTRGDKPCGEGTGAGGTAAEASRCVVETGEVTIMAKSVYIETTIPSYLAAWPSRDLLQAARQQITHEWWQTQRHRYDLYISQGVLDEAAAGDADAATRRLAFIKELPQLTVTDSVRAVARAILEAGLLPPQAARDALHIAVASSYRIDVLLTWNCRHIANAAIIKELGKLVAQFGFELPVLCTPEEFLLG